MDLEVGTKVFHLFNSHWHGKIVKVGEEGRWKGMAQVLWESGNKETQYHPVKFLIPEGVEAIRIEETEGVQSIEAEPDNSEIGVEEVQVISERSEPEHKYLEDAVN